MAEIGVKELKATASAVIEDVEAGAAYVVTKRGRPAAVLLPIEEAEDLVLANADGVRAHASAGPRRLRQGSFDEPGRSGLSTYRVELSPAAVQTYKKLPPDLQKRIRQALEKLATEAAKPGRVGGKAVKTIRGTHDAFHRLRVGDHRVTYDVIDEDRVVLVLGIVHRGDLERWIRIR